MGEPRRRLQGKYRFIYALSSLTWMVYYRIPLLRAISGCSSVWHWMCSWDHGKSLFWVWSTARSVYFSSWAVAQQLTVRIAGSDSLWPRFTRSHCVSCISDCVWRYKRTVCQVTANIYTGEPGIGMCRRYLCLWIWSLNSIIGGRCRRVLQRIWYRLETKWERGSSNCWVASMSSIL